MKAQDLRIGNYVFDKHGRIATVKTIGMFDNIRLTASGYYYFESAKLFYCKPIPITEEWLLRFGFEQEYGIMSFVKDDRSSIKITYETLADFYRLYPYTYKIKYVHQLQNLYHALTGEELTLKETTL